jgi:hypothetical protein
LVERGLKGVQLIISDACRGLTESAAEYLPEARWQRCMVHFYRNVFSHVPATKVREVSLNGEQLSRESWQPHLGRDPFASGSLADFRRITQSVQAAARFYIDLSRR